MSDKGQEIDYKVLYEQLLVENQELKERLKKYTAPSRNKKYYENHKDEVKERVKEYKKKSGYQNKPSPEKAKEYARRAYLKKKQKLLEEKNQTI
ncbi:hypothetical protein Klosneuvirus_1_271 [Klosneuvirus KNV1]|uniref:Uncharacterized protein n=1 Tax=Klosneuvirus KNV1 TaxID=1977640 RepID=A0A1V0SIE6_9VIRU|nr:hypothetical protein Klosneuvirus_1_271 [Klosneuvirus KNV1]